MPRRLPFTREDYKKMLDEKMHGPDMAAQQLKAQLVNPLPTTIKVNGSRA